MHDTVEQDGDWQFVKQGGNVIVIDNITMTSYNRFYFVKIKDIKDIMDATVSAALLAQIQNLVPKLQEMENDPSWAPNGNDVCTLYKI